MDFTWNESFTRMFSRLSDADKVLMLDAVCAYGTDSIEPDLPYPLDAMFEILRNDIDYSHAKRYNGAKGGKRKAASSTSEPASSTIESASSTSKQLEPQPTNQPTNIPTNKPEKKNIKKKRFEPPSLEQVRTHVSEKGYAFDPEAFIAHYESNGWKVGRNPMRDWKAACRTWAKNGYGSSPPKNDLWAADPNGGGWVN